MGFIGGFLSPTATLVVVGVSWATAVLGSLQLGGLLWVIFPASVVAWHTFYVAWCRYLQRYNNGSLQRLLDGYGAWSYLAAMTSGGLVLPVCLLAAAVTSGALLSPESANSFLMGTLDPNSWAMFFIAQLHASLIAGLLKDYVVYEGGLELVFAAHHIVSIAGCMLCLALPVGAGFAAANAVVAELGSTFYNYAVLTQFSRMSTLSYFVGMTASNATIGYITYELWLLEGLGQGTKTTYLIMCIFIVLLRVVGKGILGARLVGGGGKKAKRSE